MYNTKTYPSHLISLNKAGPQCCGRKWRVHYIAQVHTNICQKENSLRNKKCETENKTEFDILLAKTSISGN